MLQLLNHPLERINRILEHFAFLRLSITILIKNNTLFLAILNLQLEVPCVDGEVW